MINTIRVELPIPKNSKLLNSCKTIGNLEEKYPNTEFMKYIYLDPNDHKLKGTNPPNNTLLVADAYITVSGSAEDVEKFVKDVTSFK